MDFPNAMAGSTLLSQKVKMSVGLVSYLYMQIAGVHHPLQAPEQQEQCGNCSKQRGSCLGCTASCDCATLQWHRFIKVCPVLRHHILEQINALGGSHASSAISKCHFSTKSAELSCKMLHANTGSIEKPSDTRQKDTTCATRLLCPQWCRSVGHPPYKLYQKSHIP